MRKSSIDLSAGWPRREVRSDWIVALDNHLGWRDQPRSYRLLGAVLHAVQSALPASGRAQGGYPIVEARPLLRRVEAGFRPDRLDDPRGAVLAVLEVLDEVIDEPRLDAIRRTLLQAGTLPLDPTVLEWSATWSSPS